jgi:hypothetical protein
MDLRDFNPVQFKFQFVDVFYFCHKNRVFFLKKKLAINIFA